MADGNIGESTRLKGMTQILVGMVGVSPLLMNAMDPETLERLVTGVKPSKTASRPTPTEQAERKLYRDPEGNIVMPTTNLLSSLIEAGRSVRLDGKKQVSTASSTVLPSFLTLHGMSMPIIDPLDNTKSATWRVSIMAGRNPNGGEAVGICRPCFDSWAIEAEIDVDLTAVPERVVRELFDRSGNSIGLGDFRPQRKGMYGRYRIDKWQVKK